MYREGRLPESTDGRLSAGPIDMAAYLAQPHIKEAVRQAIHRLEALQSLQLLTIALAILELNV
jgi:hypothetical protein